MSDQSLSARLLNSDRLQNELDDLIIAKYLDLLNDRDATIRLGAVRDLARIRGHLARGDGQKGPSQATQINQFVMDPATLQAMATGMKALAGATTVAPDVGPANDEEALDAERT